jgi:diguanylate cyclase (GGDEF)-like protein
MTQSHSHPPESSGPDRPGGTPDAVDEAIRRLGEVLLTRIEDVSEGTRARSQAAGLQLDPATAEKFMDIGRGSTQALANWMAGGSPEQGRETGRRAFETYGQLAAQRLAPLNEIAKRCLRWRDAVREVLADIAAELGFSDEVVLRAGGMVQKTIDVTLVRMCECFEIERHSADEELDRRQQELSFMATHDSLTGLPNRALIIDRTEQALARARRNQTPLAALFVDVDNFKSINDLLGHETGDEVLRAVAARLDGVVRSTDALGRLGGDEFVVIAEALSPDTGPELVAERVLETLKEPITLGDDCNTSLTVTASVGVAVGERSSAEELLRDADIAMYRAKWGGKNRYVLFESGMEEAQRSRTTLEIDLREAVRNDEFFLVYQPTFDLHAMNPTGFEALLRWQHPTRGVVQPNDFIPLLEETGMVVDVGRWVLQQACHQCAQWRREGQEIGLAVNVSGRQLDTDEFIDHVREALDDSGLDAEALTLEITETTLMRNVEETARRLTSVKEHGVKIAIDDFGTGYSSLAHLQRFPVDALKIDRSFISRLTQNPEGRALLHTLVQLGKALALETLAEGIEDPKELSMLRNERCDSGQGFLFARPLEVDAAEEFLRDWEATKADRWGAGTAP